MRDRRVPFLIFRQIGGACLWLTALALPSWAQFPALRSVDTRTSTPESVRGDRKDWGADLNFGGSFNRGNIDFNYLTSNFRLFKTFEPSTVHLSGSMIYNTFNDIQVSNQGALAARYDYALQGPWKLFMFNTNAYNDFIQLDYRGTTGGGPWYEWTLGPTKHGSSLAVTHEYERFKHGVHEHAGRLSFRDISRIPISPVAGLSTDFFYVPKLGMFGDYHLFAEIDFETLFWKEYLGLKVSWIDEYDSRPRPGIRPNDTIWLTSLTVHLGK